MPTSQPLEAPASADASYARLTHNVSLALLVLCPAIAALPPRKLDLYTFSLGAAWCFSANHVVAERSGRSILQRVYGRVPSAPGSQLPTQQARDVQRRLREETLSRGAVGEGVSKGEASAGNGEEQEEKGLLEKIWMGGEKDGWKDERLKEEREAIEDGRGYQGLIMDQIREVWTWRKKGGDDEEHGADGEEAAKKNTDGTGRDKND